MKRQVIRFLQKNPSFQPIFNNIYGKCVCLKDLFSADNEPYRDDKFIFIVGSGRSGNTVLRKLLIERVNIYIPPETYVIGSVIGSFLRNPALTWQEKVNLTVGAIEYQKEFETFDIGPLRDFALEAKKWELKDQHFGYLIRKLYEKMALEKGVSTVWLGDKTPLNTLNLGLINYSFPSARYVYLERDPFDVVHSYVESGLYSCYSEAADRWLVSRYAWASHVSRIQRHRFVEVKYEDLVTDHIEQMDVIINQFSLPCNDDHCSTKIDLGDVGKRAHHSNVNKPINRDSIGKGRRMLPNEVRQMLRKKLNREAINANYAPLD